MSEGSNPINNFNSCHYNPNFYKQQLSIVPTKRVSYMTTSSQIFTGTNTYNIGSISLNSGTYQVNVNYAFQGQWSAVGSVTNCSLCISSNQSISTSPSSPTFFYCQGPALQTSVLNTLYNFGINGSGVITIANTQTIYLMVQCYYTGTAVIQNQGSTSASTFGSVSFILL